ncbi:MAG: hypothetical protein ACK5HY_07225 [Parahaliea sp.]
MPRAVLLPPLFLLAACSAPPPPPDPPENAGQCGGPRPQICTMEYQPVCGELAGGVREDFSSPCNACANDQVVSYREGRCDAPARSGNSERWIP